MLIRGQHWNEASPDTPCVTTVLDWTDVQVDETVISIETPWKSEAESTHGTI